VVHAGDVMLVQWSLGDYECKQNFSGSDYLKDKKGYEGNLEDVELSGSVTISTYQETFNAGRGRMIVVM